MMKKNTQRGFSLIEIMVSVTIFALVMLIGVGALLSLIDANRRAQAINTTINNVNAALEGMGRAIRTGVEYYCDPPAFPPSGYNNCTSGDSLAFRVSTLSNTYQQYRLYQQTINGEQRGQIQRRVSEGGGQGTWVALTAPEIDITDFIVSVVGAAPGDGVQPRVVILIEGRAPLGNGNWTTFKVQSSVVQRILDI